MFLKNQRGDREKQNKLKDFSSSVLSPTAPSLNVTAKHAHVCMLAFTLNTQKHSQTNRGLRDFRQNNSDLKAAAKADGRTQDAPQPGERRLEGN